MRLNFLNSIVQLIFITKPSKQAALSFLHHKKDFESAFRKHNFFTMYETETIVKQK